MELYLHLEIWGQRWLEPESVNHDREFSLECVCGIGPIVCVSHQSMYTYTVNISLKQAFCLPCLSGNICKQLSMSRLDANCLVGAACCVANLYVAKFCAWNTLKANETRGKILLHKLIWCREGSVKSMETRQVWKVPKGDDMTERRTRKTTLHCLHETFCNRCSVVFLLFIFRHVPY